MAKYYATVAGLPNIAVEDRKLPFTSPQFLEELRPILSQADGKLFDLLLWEQENHFLLDYLEDSEAAKTAEAQPTLFSYDNLDAIMAVYREKRTVPRMAGLPPYFQTFLAEKLAEKALGEENDQHAQNVQSEEEEGRERLPISDEDRLAMYYYEYAMQCGNEFLEEWFGLNLHIKNILAAITCRKLGWNPINYIVGTGEIENKLRTSRSRDFDLSEDFSAMSSLLAVGEETDITKRERQLDVLRWEWLEESVFNRVFSIERLLCYYLELTIIERWVNLDERTGEETFRHIVKTLKHERAESLEEFKRNQKK
ncbi:DUF2764 domain-containing protein [Porphyromonas loveana]|uniref:DUF2764 domain-containing protein n=1 Tax=Porphyromonas loveana TaxID=1884669 RepID=UPI0035A1156F